ncbi:MAG: hypothetical protein HQK54_08440 [Oligoflexales bacterium]|nr:hypothetical protein [Oligoflexales bacterium]
MLVLIGYLAFSFAYIQTYPAVQAYSPSLRIISLIGSSKNGLSKDEIVKGAFNLGSDCMERFEDLLTENFIMINEGNKLILSKKGALLAAVFFRYRRFLGLSTGEG